MALLLVLPAAIAPASSSGRAYYVDSLQGKDTSSGRSPQSAWKTLARAMATRFSPGDRLLLAANQTFAGPLRLTAEQSGTNDQGVLIGSFGQGRARIDGGTGDGIVLEGCRYVTVCDLNIVGAGRKMGSDGAGLRVIRTHNITLSRLDVSGFRIAGISTQGDADSRITHVHVRDNGGAGIEASGGYSDIPRAKNIYIGDCVAENNPGDPKNLTNHSGNGIVVGGLDGGVIEYCVASENGWDMPRDGNGPVGIWGWNCDRLVIQHCISHDNKSPGADGGGFDFDGGVTNSVLQYNLSYRNQGCGYLLCQYPGAPVWKNNIIRYNISFNDGTKNLQCGIGLWLGDSGISDAHIYNNTIVNAKHAVHSLGVLPGFVYRNNIFVAAEDVLAGDFSQSRFENNLYQFPGKSHVVYRNDKEAYETLEAWCKATGQETVSGRLTFHSADPRLILPREANQLPTDPHQLSQMPFFRLQEDSPARATGLPVENNGAHDFFGHRLPPNKPASLGAHEIQNAN